MINVLHIVLSLQVGGLERFVIDLIENYSSGVRSYIVCLDDAGELAQSCKAESLYSLHKKPGVSLSAIRRLCELARELRIDVIHTHNTSPHLHGAVAGMLAGIPVVHTKHGRNRKHGLRKIMLYRLSALLSRKVVAVSRNAADDCTHLEGIPAEKVMVILNGIDTRLFAPMGLDMHHAPQIPPRPPLQRGELCGDGICTIGIVARLSPVKDHHTLLLACKHLYDRQAQFRLLIIGDGPLRRELEKNVNELGLTEQVEFTGMRHDIPAQLHRLDMFVLSSVSEGISLTLLEAMATSLPIVATDVGGNPEVVKDGVTGFIVPPSNPEALADKLAYLIHNPDLRRRMGEEGRKRVVEQFDIRQTARKYEELYRSVLK